MEFFINRQDEKVQFDRSEVFAALLGAVRDCGGTDRKTANSLTDKVIDYLDAELDEEGFDRCAPVEVVQNAIYKILVDNGCVKVSYAFAKYRVRHELIRKLKKCGFEDAAYTVMDMILDDEKV